MAHGVPPSKAARLLARGRRGGLSGARESTVRAKGQEGGERSVGRGGGRGRIGGCERRHRCPKLDGLSSPCLSSPKGSTVPVVSPIPPFATTGTVPFFLQMAKHRPPRATESTPMLRC